MKNLLIIFGFTLAMILLTPTKPAIAEDHITAANWMALPVTARGFYVAGLIDGIEQVIFAYGMELRRSPATQVSAQIVSEALYTKLLREPELRQGPVQEILFQIVSSVLVVTDRSGRVIPSWEGLMTRSECAEFLLKMSPGNME